MRHHRDSEGPSDGPPFRIVVVGDSLSLPRAKESLYPEQTYPSIVAERIRDIGRRVELWNLSRAGTPVAGMIRRWRDTDAYLEPSEHDLTIVQLGVVDCPDRAVPPRIRSLVGRLPDRSRGRIVDFLHRHRRFLMSIPGDRSLTPPKRFQTEYRRLLTEVSARSRRTIVLDIAPAGPYFRDRSPGVEDRIARYNGFIHDIARETAIEAVSMERLFREDPDGFMSSRDGHHYGPRGHARVAEEILERVRQDLDMPLPGRGLESPADPDPRQRDHAEPVAAETRSS